MAPVVRHRFARTLLWPALAARRQWLERRARSRLALIQPILDRLVEDPVVDMPEFRGTFTIGAQSDLFKRCVLGYDYEPEDAATCAEFVDPRRDAIDVGANIGFYSVLFANLLDRGRRVLSIEPTDRALSRLRENIARNQLGDRIVCFQGVASNVTGTATINVVEGKEEYSSVGAVVHPSVRGVPTTPRQVESSTLDALCARFRLDPGFVKVDSEGWEKSVLDGAVSILRERRPVVLAEINDLLLERNGSSIEEVADLFRAVRYVPLDPLTRTVRTELPSDGNVLFVPDVATGRREP